MKTPKTTEYVKKSRDQYEYAGMSDQTVAFVFLVFTFALTFGMWIGKESAEPVEHKVGGYCQYIWYYPNDVTVAVNMIDGELYKKTVQMNGLHHDLEECE